MNKIVIAILTLFIFPFFLFSQNIRIGDLKAFIDVKEGNYQRAIDSLEVFAPKYNKAEYYLALIEANYKSGKYTEALKYCKELDKIKPAYSSEFKVWIYLELNDLSNAQNALEENLESKYKVSLYRLMEDNEFAMLNSKGLQDNVLSLNYYSKTEKQLYQVERLVKNEKYTQALFLANEIVERNPEIAQGHYFLSLSSYALNDSKQAFESINRAVELKPSNIDYLQMQVILSEEFEDYQLALQDIKKIIRLNPYEIDNYIKEADLLFKTDNFDEAIELSNEIIGVCPENADVLYLSSKSYFMKDEYFEALKAINHSLQLKGTKDSYELRGDIYVATNTYEYAVKDYSMYLDADAYNGNVYAKKGFARFKLGDKNGACADWIKGKRYGSYESVKYIEKYCE